MQGQGSGGSSKKSSQMTMGTMGLMICGLAVILLGFNYWHAMKCVESSGMGDLEDYAKAIDKRVLEIESKSLQNNILVESVLKEVQHRLAAIDVAEMQKLVESSKDEAVRIALDLATHRAPPMPEYKVDDKYRDPNELGELIDDVFQDQVNKEEENSAEFGGFEGEEMLLRNEGEQQQGLFDDYGEKGEGEVEEEGVDLSEEERKIACRDWKQTYGVVTGVSWGSLPFDLQRDWKRYDCDFYLLD